jgi:hypothetical protein
MTTPSLSAMLPGFYARDPVFTVTLPLLPDLLFEPRAQFTFLQLLEQITKYNMNISKSWRCLALALLLAAVPAFAEERPLTTAIFDFQTTAPKLEGKGSEVGLLLKVKLSSSPHLTLLERTELSKLLNEQGIALSGVADAANAAKIGQLSGAKVLVTGRLIESGARYILVAKVMSVETSRVFGDAVSFGDLAGLDAAVGELAQKVEAVLTKQAGALIAQVVEKPARFAKLQEALKGKKLPRVQVSIEEQHLNRVVPDPAAEVEFKTVLQQLGFTIVNANQVGAEPDIIIRGSGFSEMAGRRETLISCRARLEIEAVRRSDGKPLQTDRETASAVDVAEHIAGRTALQEAAFTLLERLVPKLTEGWEK